MGNSKSKLDKDETLSALEKGVNDYMNLAFKHGEAVIAEKLKKARTDSTVDDCDECEPLLQQVEVPLHELGLGRGVDGTDPHPWVNKTMFQVRDAILPEPKKKADASDSTKKDDKQGGNAMDEGDITPATEDEDAMKDSDAGPAGKTLPTAEGKTTNLIATDEGKTVHGFSEEVTSISEQTADLRLSVSVPKTPVEVSVGADLTRKLTITQRALGVRILTKTIAFKPTFDEAQERLAECMLEQIAASDLPEAKKAEKILQSLREAKLKEPGKSSEEFSKQLEALLPADEEAAKEYLLLFFNRYRVTHYVSSVTLGASFFVVASSFENLKELKIDPKLSGDLSTKIDFSSSDSIKLPSATVRKQLKRNTRNIHYIGRFKDKIVNMGSTSSEEAKKKAESEENKGIVFESENYEVEDEAVVLVKLEPITNLIKSKKLKDHVTGAIDLFIKNQKSTKEGPYKISCNDAELFLSVEEKNGHALVMASPDREKASNFYIILTGNDKHPHEFYIGWQKEGEEGEEGYGTMRYLTAPVSVLGRHDGPLCLESRARKRDSLFAINRRATDPYYRLSRDVDVIPKLWFRGEESYLIRCTRRRFRVDGFVAVQPGLQQQGNKTKTYRTTTRKNPRGQDGGNFYMAFRLHPKNGRGKQTLEADSRSKPAEKQPPKSRVPETDEDSVQMVKIDVQVESNV